MMRLPRIYPILSTDALTARGIALETAAAAFLEGGAGILQLRHKGHWGRDLFASARTVARLCAEAGSLFVINDRADFSLLLDAGLHVGQDDLSVRDARRLMGADAVIGFSTHNVGQLCAAGGESVDYLALGPVFSTASKANPDPVVGVEEFQRCRPLVQQPLVAIGGITLDNLGEVFRAGADSVAVIAALLPPSPTARSLRERMEQWQQTARTCYPSTF